MNQQEWFAGGGVEYTPELLSEIHRIASPMRRHAFMLSNATSKLAKSMRAEYAECESPYQSRIDELDDNLADLSDQVERLEKLIDAVPASFLGYTESVIKGAMKDIQKARREKKKREVENGKTEMC